MGDFKFQVGDPVFASDRPECAVVMLRHRTGRQNVYLIGWQGGKIMTIQDEADLRPVEPKPTPEDEFRVGDRVRHNKHGWVGTVHGVRFRDGTFLVKWDESITTFSDHIHPRDLTRIDEKDEKPAPAEETPASEPAFEIKVGDRVWDVSIKCEGIALASVKRDGKWGWIVIWDGHDWMPQWIPDGRLVAVQKKKAEEPTMPADPNAGRPTCATCPMMAVVPPTREVSVEASQKYPDANVHECHALPPARSLVMPWPPTTPDQFCGAHPDFQTWLDARDMARQGERPAREG